MYAYLRKFGLSLFNGFGLTGVALGLFSAAIAADLSVPRREPVGRAIVLQVRWEQFHPEFVGCFGSADCIFSVEPTCIDEAIAFKSKSTWLEVSEADALIDSDSFRSTRCIRCFVLPPATDFSRPLTRAAKHLN